MDYNYIFLAILLSSTLVQAELTVTLGLRPRGEFRQGYKSLALADQPAAVFVSQRSRLGIKVESSELKAAFILQDVRVWGDESQYSSSGVTGDAASLDLKEAWIEHISPKGLNVKIGRQEFNYDDQRLLSQRNWNQAGVNYDALLLKYQQPKYRLHLALSLNNETANRFGNLYPADKMKTLNFIYFQTSGNEKLSLSAIALGSGYTAHDSSEVIYMRGSYGVNLVHRSNRQDIRAAAYYQNGRNRSGQQVSAYLLSLDWRYRIHPISFGGGAVCLSGQDAAKQDSQYQKRDHLFDIIYGARHRYYGLMDYFSNLSAGTGKGGLIDVYSTLELPLNRVRHQLVLHLFHLHSRVRHAGGGPILDSYLGSELDYSFTAVISDALTLQGGYSAMLPSESLELIQGLNAGESEYSHWGWLMLTCNVTLFKNK